MRRLIQIALIVAFLLAAGYALVVTAIFVLAYVAPGCGCAATPSPPLP